MQAYYERHLNSQGPSDLTLQLTFVITICNILINLMAPLGQILVNRFKTRLTLFISVIICSAGLVLAGFSTKVLHLYLTQGVVYGIGCSIMFYIALTVVPKWFSERKGLALGVLSSGISIGGLAMPLIMEPLNSRLGAAWCFRILGFICFGLGMISCLLLSEKNVVKTNDDEKKHGENDVEKFSFKKIFNFGSVLKNPRFLLWVASEIFMETAFNVPIVFIPSYATYIGLTSSEGAVILSVCSGMNAVGRLCAGFAADFLGHVNVILIYTVIAGLSSLLVWMYATSFGMLMAFAVIFGFFGGAFITLTPTITLLVTGSEGFECGVSAFLVLSTVAQFGPNLASAVELTVHDTKPFDTYKYFTGVSYLLGASLLLIFKFSLNRNPLTKI
ncbi:major facilitator superfamily domain-containing protein [Mycotypha africana]|uniref:major facilitator superfamily domain-containing protein n=1 Tax=Mycotypha africana TaxID=64632 RepID=UPI002300391D|nr:major facilitator superfamily domain-containing protein [Mycotypha africana]KAI8991907.1 major facilitator superfamily domain-containing protein [Mycotypha africana]